MLRRDGLVSGAAVGTGSGATRETAMSTRALNWDARNDLYSSIESDELDSMLPLADIATLFLPHNRPLTNQSTLIMKFHFQVKESV